MKEYEAGCGHGHVYPNADGSVARCGGPHICAACARDYIQKYGKRPEVPMVKKQDPINESDKVRFSVDQHGDTVILTLAKPGKEAKHYKLTPGQASKLAGQIAGASLAASINESLDR